MDVALGKNLLVTRAANKGAVAISLPLTLPSADRAAPGRGSNGRQGTVVKTNVDSAVHAMASGPGAAALHRSALTFVTCHLASDLGGTSGIVCLPHPPP